MTTVSQENLLGYVNGNKLGHDNSQMSNTFLGYYKDNWYGHDFIQRPIIIYTYTNFDAYPLREIIRPTLIEEDVDVMMLNGQERIGTLNGVVVSEEYLAGGEGYSMGGQYGDGEVLVVVKSTDGTDVADYVVKTREELGNNYYTYVDAFYGSMTDEIWNVMQSWFLPTTYEYTAFDTSSIRSAYDTWALTNLNTQQIVLSNERGIRQEAYAGGQLVGTKYLYVANTSGPTGPGLLIIESNDGTTIAQGDFSRITFATEYVSGVSSLRSETDGETLFVGGKSMIPKTGVLNYGDPNSVANTHQAYKMDSNYGSYGVIVDWSRIIIRGHHGWDVESSYLYNSSPIYGTVEASSYGITFSEWEKTIKLLAVGGQCMFKTTDGVLSGESTSYSAIPDFPPYGNVTNFVGWERRNSSFEYDILNSTGKRTHIYHSGALGSGTLSVDLLAGEYLYQNIVWGSNLDAQLQTDNAGIQPGPDVVVHFFRTGALPQAQSATYYQDTETKTYKVGSSTYGTVAYNKADGLLTISVPGTGSITIKDRNVGASYPYYQGWRGYPGDFSEQPPAGFHQMTHSELTLLFNLLNPGGYVSIARLWDLLLIDTNYNIFGTTQDGGVYYKMDGYYLSVGTWGNNQKATTRWVQDTQTIVHRDTQGPCPNGFHIGTKDEWQTLITALTAVGAYDVNYIKTYLKIPDAYYLARSNGTKETRYGTVRMWTSTMDSNTVAYAWGIDENNNFVFQSDKPGNGFSIRPFKDNPVAPDSSRTQMYTGIYWSSTLGLISVQNGNSWITMSDRNLGATNVGDNGLFYQFGNNTGYTYSASPYVTSKPTLSDNYGPGNYYTGSFVRVSRGNNWFNGACNNIWGGVTNGTWTDPV